MYLTSAYLRIGREESVKVKCFGCDASIEADGAGVVVGWRTIVEVGCRGSHPGPASAVRNAVPNISHAVTKSAARIGPRMKPIAPKCMSPPKPSHQFANSSTGGKGLWTRPGSNR